MNNNLSMEDRVNIEIALEMRVNQLADMLFGFPDIYWFDKAKEIANTFRNVTGFDSPQFDKLVKRMGKYRFIGWEHGNPFDLDAYFNEISMSETFYGIVSERMSYILLFDKDLNYLGTFNLKCFERTEEEDAT